MKIILIIILIQIFSKKIIYNKKLISFLESMNQEDYTPQTFEIRNSYRYMEFFQEFQKYFENKNKTRGEGCFEEVFINKIIDYNYDNLYFYSGHKLTEIGDETSCIKSNGTYILALLTYKINETSVKLEDKMSIFTSKEKSSIGLCVWSECNEFIKNALVDTVDTQFKKNLNQFYNIKDIKVNYNYEELNEEKNNLSTGIKIFAILLLIYIIIFIILKIIMAIINSHKKSVEKEIFELKKKNKKDYLKMDETDIIKEEENEDDINEEEDEDEKKNIKYDSKNMNQNLNELNNIENLDENKNKNKKNNKTEEENEEEEDEENEEEEDDEDNDDSKISNDSLFKKEIEQSKIKYIERNLNKLVNNNVNEGDLEYDLEDKYSKKINLLENENKKNKTSNFVSSMNNFNDIYLNLIKLNSLTEYKNQIYSNKGLEMITGLRTFFLILITLNTSFNTFQQSPAIKQINYTFLQHFLIGSIKFSSFGIYFWIYLDGFVYTFKLMYYVKKNRDFKYFVKFLINLIPKIFVYIIIFYGVYFFQKDINKLTVSNLLFEQYTENEYDYKCLKNPLYLLLPFISNVDYKNEKMIYNYFNNCYQFSYIIINEFYCIIILITLFYFLYKYKSMKLDLSISIIMLLSIILINLIPYFIENIKNEKYYLLKYVLGETFSQRYPLPMFNIFFIGSFCGLIYYYHYSVLNDLGSYLNEDYHPFQFLSSFKEFLYKLNWIIKLILVLISLGIIFLDCIIFYIVEKKGTDAKILYNFSGLLKFFYLYEVPIVILCISALIIFLLFAEDKFQIKAFLGSKIFYIMEKVSFSYICLIQMVVLIFLSSSNYHGETWTFLFFYYTTCYEFAFGIFASFIVTLVFELPAKILANNLRGKNMKEKN